MRTGVLFYRSVQSLKELTVRKGPKLSVRSEVCWDSENPDDKKIRRVVTVEGVVESRGRSWPVKWEFEWPAQELNALEAGLRLILKVVEQGSLWSVGSRPPKMKNQEVYVDVFDWLRAGWIEAGEESRGYLAFRKDDFVLTCEFEDNEGLKQIRDALRATM